MNKEIVCYFELIKSINRKLIFTCVAFLTHTFLISKMNAIFIYKAEQTDSRSFAGVRANSMREKHRKAICSKFDALLLKFTCKADLTFISNDLLCKTCFTCRLPIQNNRDNLCSTKISQKKIKRMQKNTATN